MTEFFDLETRKKIYRLIEQHPGLNLSTIAEMLRLDVPLVDYHTRYFEKNELIVCVKETGFKRYYVKGSIGATEQVWFDLLRQEIPLKIVLFLLKNPSAKHAQMLPVFEVSKSTLSYHLQKLVRKGIILVEKQNEEVTYVVADEKKIVAFLLRYRPSAVLKRFSDTWDDFGLP
jgi:predicted transcriptional regulator